MDILYAKVTELNAGYESDRINALALDSDHYYVVNRVNIGGSSTSIYLEDDRKSYNSVNFTFYTIVDGKHKEYDIFSDPNYNPYLQL